MLFSGILYLSKNAVIPLIQLLFSDYKRHVRGIEKQLDQPRASNMTLPEQTAFLNSSFYEVLYDRNK